MSLTPQIRPDRNGKLVTRHVKTSQSVTAKALPAPSAPSAGAEDVFKNDDTIREALYLHMPENEADEYFSFITRKPKVIQEALAKALGTVEDKEQFNAALSVVDEFTDKTLAVIALDSLDFIIAIAQPPHGTRSPYDGTSLSGSTNVYSGALMVMGQTYRNNFKRDALDPETIDLNKYGPYLRASTLTHSLGLDSRAPTTMDEAMQRQHVSEHADTFARHYPALIRITQATNTSPQLADSHALLEVCEVLEERPGSVNALVDYVNERNRFDMDEFRDILDAPSRSMSSGTL